MRPVGEKLCGFNHKLFQKKEGSRATAFEEERQFLLPLLAVPFEMAMWKLATVQYNYHISVNKQSYSVPYEYIKQKVDVRLTSHTVEVFFEGNRIASHPQLYGRPNQYSTLETHMPPDHQKYLQWNGERFLRWAEQIDANAETIVRHFLTMYAVEQQGYKARMALLKLTDKYPPERLESACQKALSYTPQPSYKSIQSILKSGQDKLLLEEPEPTMKKASQYSYTRGADYYWRDK